MSLEAPLPSAVRGFARKPPRRAEVADWRPVAAAIAVAAGVVLGLLAEFGLIALDPHGRALVAASGLLVDAVLLAAVLLSARRGAQRLGPATLGLRRTPVGPALGWGAAVLGGVWLAEIILTALLAGHGQEHHGRHAAGAFAPDVAVLLVLAVAVSAPIVEEIAFRGYLFPALAGWRGPWIGALLTAVLFASAHVLALPPAFLPGIAVFGFGACLLRWFTGSLLPGVAIHAFNNAVVLTALSRGQLWWAIPAAPLVCLALLAPFSRTRAEDVETAVAETASA